MKSHINLFTTVLQEAGQSCGVNTSQDMKTILRRLSKEGESFLTISLPAYEKDLLQALDRGRISSDLFSGFQKTGGFPKLFSGFLRKIFDSSCSIRPTSDDLVRAIRMLRQVLLLLSKIELVSSPDRENLAVLTYKRTDVELKSHLENNSEEGKFLLANRDVQAAFGIIFNRYCSALEKELYEDPFFRGNHGPGAVADRTGNNARWSNRTWTTRLESILPVESTLACNIHDYMDNEYEWLDEDQEPPVRVVTVPKTMKGPRVIAIEPVHMQYVQQGLFALMTRVLLRPEFSLLNATMGWTDQEPNRVLAADHERYATVDLSEASDRVSFALVESLFERFPLLWGAMKASRSLRAQTPDGDIITLTKFASMGSALCFPVESMVFTAIAGASLYRELGSGWSYHSSNLTEWEMLRTPFRVFGDDIIIPKDWTPNLLEILSLCGLKVNLNKSFWTGKFRESCGADWYDGFNVSVEKVRRTISPGRQDVASIVRGISLHNRLFERGMLESAKAVEDALLSVRPMLYAPYGSTVLALWTYDLSKVITKTDSRYHRPSVKSFSLRYKYRKDELDSYGALRKYFARVDETVLPWEYDILKQSVRPTDPEHLRHAGRPVHVAMTVRYAALY